MHVSVQVMKEDGIKGFYRGCTTNLVRTTPAAALTFTSYEMIARRMRAHGARRREEEERRSEEDDRQNPLDER